MRGPLGCDEFADGGPQWPGVGQLVAAPAGRADGGYGALPLGDGDTGAASLGADVGRGDERLPFRDGGDGGAAFGQAKVAQKVVPGVGGVFIHRLLRAAGFDVPG